MFSLLASVFAPGSAEISVVARLWARRFGEMSAALRFGAVSIGISFAGLQLANWKERLFLGREQLEES
jgi:hypothetical protein